MGRKSAFGLASAPDPPSDRRLYGTGSYGLPMKALRLPYRLEAKSYFELFAELISMVVVLVSLGAWGTSLLANVTLAF